MKRFLFTCLTLLFVWPMAASAGGSIAPITMENLAEKEISFPAAFDGEPTLVILAFEHGQQEEADRAIALIEQAQATNPALRWFEFPIIGNPPAMARFFIRNGMRDAINEARQPYVLPFFLEDKDAWRKAAGVDGTDAPLLAKVDPQGAILKTAPLASITTAEQVLAF